VAAFALASCARVTHLPESDNSELIVFAAASLSDAFEEVGRRFEAAHPGTHVAFNFAGSHALRTQIREGASADVFASADSAEMEEVIASGQAAPGSSRVFAHNSLIVVAPVEGPVRIETPEDLARPGVKLVLAAEEVPAGKYARQVLSNLNQLYGPRFAADVLGNVVSNEDSVRQVLAKVQLGEADAGIVYVSDAAVAGDAVRSIDIDASHNVVATYPVTVLNRAAEGGLAEEFVAFLLSPDGQAVLSSFGFLPAGGG
jgi:molybdate transport system substrate-binding protein